MPDCSQLIEQVTRPLADDDPRAFGPPGEQLGIDAPLVGHRNDQQPDSPRLELIAERPDRGKGIGGTAFGSIGLTLDQVAHTRSVGEPALTPQTALSPASARNLH